MRYQAALRSDEPRILSGFRIGRQIQDRIRAWRTRDGSGRVTGVHHKR
jgi:hypothetical protein